MLKTQMILKPLINEKSMVLTKNDMYTFLVGTRSNKRTIARIIEQKFKVSVLSVKTINVKGKTKAQRSRKGYFSTPISKKAIVKVKKGQKIAIFERAQPEEEVEVLTAEGKKVTEVKEKKSLLKGTKVRIEREAKALKPEVAAVSEEVIQRETEPRRAETKTGQKEGKK